MISLVASVSRLACAKANKPHLIILLEERQCL